MTGGRTGDASSGAGRAGRAGGRTPGSDRMTGSDRIRGLILIASWGKTGWSGCWKWPLASGLFRHLSLMDRCDTAPSRP